MSAPTDTHSITVIGAGLAGSEASFQLAEAGFDVRLIEMKPHRHTPAQISDHFAELVCSNSFRSNNPENAVGLLKEEMGRMGSLVIQTAHAHRVPAGDALAVDRTLFGQAIESRLRAHPNITIEARCAETLPRPEDGQTIVATGPLTDSALAEDIGRLTGHKHLAFFDAIAPIVSGDSLDREHIFAASRWNKGNGDDYLNCPLDQDAYSQLIALLREAESYPSHAFEKPKYFQGCMPIEAMAAQGEETLRFGPLKPVGLFDPRTNKRPYAVVQLRAEDHERQAFNLVGMQTKLKQAAQRQMLALIPGLKNAQVLRYGAMHRNTYLDAPALLDRQLRLKAQPNIHFAGQITGVEGYVESAACGLIVALGIILAKRSSTHDPLPEDTALGALWRHVLGERRLPNRPHEPQNVNWGMWPKLDRPDKIPHQVRPHLKTIRVARARLALGHWAKACELPVGRAPDAVDEQAHFKLQQAVG